MPPLPFWPTLRLRLADALLARRIDRWITGTTAVLLVTLGFFAGRWSLLTSREIPVVFTEAPGRRSEEASPGALEALTTEETPTPTPSPLRGETPASRAPLGALVASSQGTKYYHPSCTEVRRIKEENLIWFDSAEEAAESGYEPSACVQRER